MCFEYCQALVPKATQSPAPTIHVQTLITKAWNVASLGGGSYSYFKKLYGEWVIDQVLRDNPELTIA